MNILAINNKTKNKNMATKKILTDIVSNGDIESTSFIKTDGTSSQFLKADGSVDTSTYALTSSIPSGNNIIDWTTDLGATNIHVNNYQKREISDTPTDGYSHIAISSNWAFDNVGTAVPADAVFTDTVNTFDGAYSSLSGTPNIPSGNNIIDWTVDQGATNIHANNYTNFLYTHPYYSATNIDTSGATIVDVITTNSTGHVTALGTRTLTLADLGYTGETDANNITSNSQLTNGAGYLTSSSSNLNHDNLTGFVSNEHIDWTTDQGATNIHANNYTDTTYDLSGYLLNTTDAFTGDLTVDGQVNFDDTDNYVGINADDKLAIRGELALSFETGDGIVVNLDDTATITGTTALSLNGGSLDMSNISGGKNFAFPNTNGTIALTSDFSGTNTGDQDLSGLLLNTTDTLDGSLTVDGGTGVATSGGTLILKQKGDTISDGIAITSSNAVSHRIWKDSSGNLNMGGSGAGSSFKQDLSGNLTILGTTSAPKFYVSTAPATSAWVFHMRNSASTADSGLYFDAGHGNLLLRDTSNNLNVRLRGGGGDSYFLGDLAIGSDNASSGIGSTRILRVASNGNSEVNVDHTDGGVSSDIGLFSFSRAGDILAYTKASHDGATNSAFMSFHTQTAGGSFSNLTSNERMRITSIGRLGIGTTNPNQKLDIIGGTNAGLRISATDTTSNWRDISIRSYTSEAEADALPEGVHMFTTNPSSATGNAFSKYGGFVIQCREDGNSSFAVRVGASLAEAFFINHNAAATFLSTVTASNFILSSDKRLKENIKKVDNKHIDVDWKTFEMKSDNSQNRYGVIAQELEEVHPEFVRTDDKGMKSVAYIDLLIAKIAELEARLDKANI